MSIRLTILLFISCSIARGQSTITGRLLDAPSGEPIRYATVALYSQSDSSLVTGTFSDPIGDFVFDKVSNGLYYVEARFLGYESGYISDIRLDQSKEIQLAEIFLRPNEQMLAEIEITGKKLTIVNKADRQVFDAQSFQASKGGTAKDIVRNLPSMTVSANGEIRARGTGGFVLMIDGRPIQGDATILLNQLPANAVASVELITAPSAKYDPEGKAGIININTKENAYEGLFAQANIRLGAPSIQGYDNAQATQRYGTDFTLNYRHKKWNLSLGGSYIRNDIAGRREGDVFTIIEDTLTRFPSDGERSFDETNLSGRFTLDYALSKRTNISLGIYGGKRSKDRTADILYFDNHRVVNDDRQGTLQYFNENLRIRKSDFAVSSLDFAHTFANQSKLRSSFLHEYTLLGGPTTNRNLAWPETSRVLQDEFNTNENPLNGFRYQLDYLWKPFALGQIETGYQLRHLDHRGDFVYERKNNASGLFELVPAFSSEVNLTRLIHSGYAQLTGQKNKWQYSAGIRVESMDRTLDLKDKSGTLDTTYRYDFMQPFPSASLQYALNESLTIKAAYSRRIERTTTFKMNPFPEREHSETLEQGDPELLPEFINLYELGIIKDLKKHSLYATAYIRDVSNVVNRVNTVFNDTILNRIYSNVGSGRAIGLESGLELQLKEKRWDSYLGGNVYNYAIDGTFDGRAVDTQSWIYSINANTTYAWDNDWSLQATFNYLSARNTAQGSDSRFYNPSLTLQKSFLENRLTATLQWLNMDLGLLESNEQRITTSRPGEFFTTTNYVYEVDLVMLNFSYRINSRKNNSRFIQSEFGEKEF